MNGWMETQEGLQRVESITAWYNSCPALNRKSLHREQESLQREQEVSTKGTGSLRGNRKYRKKTSQLVTGGNNGTPASGPVFFHRPSVVNSLVRKTDTTWVQIIPKSLPNGACGA